jgi:hypothetical protein
MANTRLSRHMASKARPHPIPLARREGKKGALDERPQHGAQPAAHKGSGDPTAPRVKAQLGYPSLPPPQRVV